MKNKHPSVHVINLNYNGKTLLKKYMPSLVRATEASSYACKLTVIDNASEDDSVDFLAQNYSHVNLFKAKENKVLCSFNNFIFGITEDIVILLNNDIALSDNAIDPLVMALINNPNAFFASTYEDCALPVFEWGILSLTFNDSAYQKRCEQECMVLSAGIAAFDREKFIALEGYDDLFLPGRYEDLDLCYRGWKRGWVGIYVPQSKKFHEGGTTFNKKYASSAIQRLVFRNGILFMVKNITDSAYLLRFVILCPLKVVVDLIRGRSYSFHGLIDACARIPKALQKRRSVQKEIRMSDHQIIERTSFGNSAAASPVKWMKKFVNLIYQNAIAYQLFLWLGFLSVRLVYPVQYLIIRELTRMKSVLDLGCGHHSMIGILAPAIYKVGVELHRPYFEISQNKARHNKVICEDVRKVEFEDKSFEAVTLMDVLEHLTKEEGLALISKMKRWASKKIVIFTPNGYWEQHEYDGNPLMRHLSGWTVQEMRDLGFTVYGVGRFKSWVHGHEEHHEERKNLKEYLLDLSQIFTYHWPEHAAQLFCVWTSPERK